MTGFTPEEWRTAARVARRSIFTEGNPDLADAWEKAADQVEARLILAGGMALTAEQVEGLKFALEAVTSVADVVPELRGTLSTPVGRLVKLLRALFPATEPAAVRDGSDLVVVQRSHTAKAVQSWMTLDLWTDLGKKDKDFDAEYERQGFGDLWAILLGEVRALVQATTPAPAEPAEEDTKAELCAVRLCVLPARHSGVHADREGLRWNNPTSSPVVPAPNETGPWEDISEAPKHLTLIDRVGDKWTYDGDDWVTPETAILPVMSINKHYAPFVAAPTGTGPWQTWRDVPDGVSYRSSRPGSPLTFTNRNGVRFVNSTGMPDEFERLQPFNAVKEQS